MDRILKGGGGGGGGGNKPQNFAGVIYGGSRREGVAQMRVGLQKDKCIALLICSHRIASICGTQHDVVCIYSVGRQVG